MCGSRVLTCVCSLASHHATLCVTSLDARVLHAANRQDQYARTIHLHEGQQVVRGPDWKWGRQDGSDEDGAGRLLGAAARGVVVEVKGTGWCKVRWATGIQETYRAGAEDGTRVRCRGLHCLCHCTLLRWLGHSFCRRLGVLACFCLLLVLVCFNLRLALKRLALKPSLLLSAAGCRLCPANVTCCCDACLPNDDSRQVRRGAARSRSPPSCFAACCRGH